MLILTRRPNEAVLIGPDVKVTVLGIKGDQVRIGFDAPREIDVDREEIALRKERERQDNLAAAQPTRQVSNTLRLAPGRTRRRSNTVDGNR